MGIPFSAPAGADRAGVVTGRGYAGSSSRASWRARPGAAPGTRAWHPRLAQLAAPLLLFGLLRGRHHQPFIKAFQAALEQYGRGYHQYQTAILNTAAADVVQGRKTPQQALDDAARENDAFLAQLQPVPK
jgi:hypothetical protein